MGSLTSRRKERNQNSLERKISTTLPSEKSSSQNYISKKTKVLTQEEVAKRLKDTKGHQASKWGRRWILRKINGCEMYPYKDKQNAKRKTNAQLVNIGFRFLGLSDDYLKSLDVPSKIKKSASMQLYCWSLQNQKAKVVEPCVYAIGNDEFVKVGFSTNVQKRLRGIQTGCPYPISILNVFRGLNKENERVFHAKLSKYKTHGEWFKRCEAVDKILELDK